MIFLYMYSGGWSVLNIPGDGTEWGINSTQFIREKTLGSLAFYSINVIPNGDLTKYILEVLYIHINIIVHTMSYFMYYRCIDLLFS